MVLVSPMIENFVVLNDPWMCLNLAFIILPPNFEDALTAFLIVNMYDYFQ